MRLTSTKAQIHSVFRTKVMNKFELKREWMCEFKARFS